MSGPGVGKWLIISKQIRVQCICWICDSTVWTSLGVRWLIFDKELRMGADLSFCSQEGSRRQSWYLGIWYPHTSRLTSQRHTHSRRFVTPSDAPHPTHPLAWQSCPVEVYVPDECKIQEQVWAFRLSLGVANKDAGAVLFTVFPASGLLGCSYQEHNQNCRSLAVRLWEGLNDEMTM